MAKVRHPLLSGDAYGKFGKGVIYRRGGVVTRSFKPRNPNSELQQAQRQYFLENFVAGLTKEQADLLYAAILHLHDDVYSPLDHGHDHGALGGLGDDDHSQYLTPGRGDVRYSQLTHEHEQSGGDIVRLAGEPLAEDALIIDFPIIPTGYTNLLLKGSARIDMPGAGGASMYMTINNDWGANYTSLATVLYPPNLEYTAEDRTSGFGFVGGANTNGDVAGNYSTFTIDIANYLGTANKKSWVSSCFLSTTDLANGTRVFYCGGHRKNTEAINRLTFSRGAGVKYKAGTLITLYGLK